MALARLRHGSILYEIVAKHLQTFLAETREKHDRGFPIAWKRNSARILSAASSRKDLEALCRV